MYILLSYIGLSPFRQYMVSLVSHALSKLPYAHFCLNGVLATVNPIAVVNVHNLITFLFVFSCRECLPAVCILSLLFVR